MSNFINEAVIGRSSFGIGSIAGKAVDDTKDITITASGAVTCSDYTTESDCTAASCYWYDGACHSKPKGDEEIPWGVILAVAGGVLAVIGIAVAR